MAKACGINSFKETMKKIKEENPIVKGYKAAEKKTETDTSFFSRMYESIKNAPRKIKDSGFVSHYWKNAAVADLVRAIVDVNKIRSRWIFINKDIKYTEKPLAGDPDAIELWRTYNRNRVELVKAKQIRESNLGVEVPKALESSEGFNDFRATYDGEGEATIDKYVETLQKAHDALLEGVLSNEATLKTHKLKQGLAKRKIDRLRRIDAEATADIIGKFENPLDVIDALVMKLQNANGHQRNFYKMTLGIDVDIALNGEHKWEFVAHHMLDMYEKGIELMSYLKKDSVNKEFMESLVGSLDGADMVDFEYISKLQAAHPTKALHNEMVKIVTDNKETIKVFNEVFGLKDGVASDVQKLIMAAEYTNGIILKHNLGKIADGGLERIVNQDKNLYKNLHNFFNNGKNYDIAEMGKEIMSMQGIRNLDGVLKTAMINKLSRNQYIIDKYKKAIKSEMLGNAEAMLEKLGKKYPDHSFVTINGTKVTDVIGRFNTNDITNNKEILGHLADLNNPDILSKEFIDLKEIQEMGVEKLKEKFIDGRILVVPTKKVEVIRRIKHDINESANKGVLKTINGMFSKYTLFAPWAYPGYALTTQIFGNIGHTVMGDPTSFKHWPKVMLELKKAWDGRYEDIEDTDMREIVRSLMTTENGSLHKFTADDWEIEGWEEVAEELRNRKTALNKTWVKKKVDAIIGKTTKTASLIELVSRGAMAYEVLNKQRAGKTYLPTTANPHRVDYLWDYDPHLAAVRLANDAHIDYGAAHGIVKKLSRYSPFLSFKVGSSVNMARSWANTYQAVSAAIKGNGDWRHAGVHLTRGAIGLLYRAGAAATVWGSIMVATGWYNEADRQRNNSYGGSIFNEIFGKMGIHFDNHIFIPGTKITLIDSLLRLNRANRKWDVFDAAEGMIPGLDKKWRDSFKEEGMMGIARTAGGIFASSLTPAFKIPTEFLLGWGDIYENGYHAPDKRMSNTESFAIKMANFIGASSVARTFVKMKEGIDTEYKSPAAYDVNEFKSELFDLTRTEEDDKVYEATKLLNSALSHFNTKWTIEAVRQLEYALQQQQAAKGRKLTAAGAAARVRERIKQNTLQQKVRANKKWFEKLTQRDKDRVIKSIEAEKTFLQSLGIGRI